MIQISSALVKARRILFATDSLRPFGEMVKISSRKATSEEFGYTNRIYTAGLPRIFLPYLAPFKDDESKELLTFEEIAQNPDGGDEKKLAMLKADIDNLGLLFGSALGERWSLTRYADLSYHFQLFFSSYIAHLIETNERYRNNIYVVFSGGDDLCILGPWDIVMEFSIDLHSNLESYTNKNNAVTLSAGIVLAASSLPLRSFAAMADEAINASKQRLSRGKIVKNGITVFGVTLSWDEWAAALEDGKQMFGHIRGDVVSRALLYHLIEFSHRAERVQEGNLRDLLWASNFTYQLSRTFEKKESKLRQWYGEFARSPETMIRSRVSASYALYKIRDLR